MSFVLIYWCKLTNKEEELVNDLMDIEDVAQDNNSEMSITGKMITFDFALPGNSIESYAIQRIEGEQQAVEQLYEAIQGDHRGRGYTKVARFYSERKFED